MRKTGLLCFSFLLFQALLFAQENVVTEKEIKTNGLYYYGQGIEETEAKAKEESRHELITMISNDYGNNGKLEQDKDLLAAGIEYLYFPRGDKTRALAFILKTKVTELNSKGKLQVNQIKYEDKVITPETKFAEIPVEKVQPVTVVISEKERSEETPKTVNPIPSNLATASESDLLKYFISYNNVTELAPVLGQLSAKGVLAFGNTSTMIYPEKYYFIVFSPDNGEIIAFLDKGSGNMRTNLLNNSTVENFLITYKDKKIVWLQIF